MDTNNNNRINLNLDEGTARTMCYVPVFGVVLSGILIILERNVKVKRDAIQAILLWFVVVILDWMLKISVITRGLAPLIDLVGMIVVPLFLAIKAHNNENTKIPFLADLTEAILGLFSKRSE